MQSFLNQSFLGNSIWQYISAVIVLIIGIIAVKIFKKVILSKFKKWAEKTKTAIDDFLLKQSEKIIIPLLYYGSVYLAVTSLTLNYKIEKFIDYASIILVTFFVIRLITSIINVGLDVYLGRRGTAESKRKELKGITSILNILIWLFGIMFLLENLGFNIGTIIAGLGIGGIAIALAAQTILGDLFSYFVIFLDRPFEIGDFIVVGDKSGAVEYIGIKSTRLRAIGGEQLVISNKDLTDSRIHNYKKMEKRRVVFNLGVTYQTTVEQLAAIPKIVKETIEEQNEVTFDRAHFATYGDSSLNFECVYYVIGADYTKYMDIQQAINLKIYKEFEKLGVEFAYPTRTVFISKDE